MATAGTAEQARIENGRPGSHLFPISENAALHDNPQPDLLLGQLIPFLLSFMRLSGFIIDPPSRIRSVLSHRSCLPIVVSAYYNDLLDNERIVILAGMPDV